MNTTVIKSQLPKDSILNRNHKTYDYVDSFQASFADNGNKISSRNVGIAFFTSGTKWVESLFALRNKIVSAFGLKVSGSVADMKQQLADFKCESGERLGLFKVFDKTDNEVVLGEDDKHLNFRVSLFLDQTAKSLTVSTTVEFNNWLGRLYFLPVRPFHKRIVPTMLKGIIKDLEQQNH